MLEICKAYWESLARECHSNNLQHGHTIPIGLISVIYNQYMWKMHAKSLSWWGVSKTSQGQYWYYHISYATQYIFVASKLQTISASDSCRPSLRPFASNVHCRLSWLCLHLVHFFFNVVKISFGQTIPFDLSTNNVFPSSVNLVVNECPSKWFVRGWLCTPHTTTTSIRLGYPTLFPLV